jgi:hypothetical protein
MSQGLFASCRPACSTCTQDERTAPSLVVSPYRKEHVQVGVVALTIVCDRDRYAAGSPAEPYEAPNHYQD